MLVDPMLCLMGSDSLARQDGEFAFRVILGRGGRVEEAADLGTLSRCMGQELGMHLDPMLCLMGLDSLAWRDRELVFCVVSGCVREAVDRVFDTTRTC